MQIKQDFDPADPGETQSYSFDFTGDIGASDMLTGVPVWSLAVESTETGATADADPASHLHGGATVDATGKFTSQFLAGLVAGNRYRVQAVCQTVAGETVSLYSHVDCRSLT